MIQDRIAQGENLTTEFKSDRGPLDDAELLNTVVCMANAEGGLLLVGVEDDGAVTGLHPSHRTRPELLTAFVASRTVPPLTVETTFETLTVAGQRAIVATLRIPASPHPVATSDGRLLIRYLDTHGRPGCRPLYPHELAGWRADRGQADVTAYPFPDANWDDLDPLEFARLRRMVEENRGDVALLELSDREIARALGLVRGEGETLTPTLAGLLLVGKETALRRHVPAHEVAFQVLRGLDVAINEFRRWPLLRIHEWVTQAIEVRNEEHELMVNGFRVGVPRYDRRGIREAVNNALIHRDYARLGAVHVQLHDDHALITNPGGFVVGVQADRLLIVSPHPRNPVLADAFKRVGLVERTGRGVGIIYTGQLRNGRAAPSYDRSTDVSVTVVLDSRPADLGFVLLAIRANRQLGRALGVDELLTLWELWHKEAVNAPTLAPRLQRDPDHAADVLDTLTTAGLLQADGPTYRLKSELRASAERNNEPTPLDPESVILAYIQTHGRITRREVIELCGVNENQAAYLLKKRRQRRQRRTRPRRPTSSRPTGGIQLVTPEGDEIVVASAHYQHSALEEIRQILKQADDFDIDDDLQPELNEALVFSWLETRSGGRSQLAPLGQRILATLTLTPTALEIEAMSQQRLDNCCRRLEELLGTRVRLIETQAKSADQALRESEPGGEKPFIPPPEVVAEIEEQMLRRWIDESVPALGGLTPREAVKTSQGRQQVLELLEYVEQMQKRTPKTPGMFSPDYRKAKKMLGLE